MKEWIAKVWSIITDRDVSNAEYAADEQFFIDAHNDLFAQSLDPVHAANVILNRYHLSKINKLTTWEETTKFYNETNSSL